MIALLSSPRRREILRLVWTRPRPAGEIHRALGPVTFGAVSQHLRALEAAGLLECRTDGRYRRYVARPERLGSLRAWLEEMWDSALYRLRLQAEMEASRRGPRPRAQSAPGPGAGRHPRRRT